MTDHPLDNHLWNALNGVWAGYSRAVGRVRLVSPDIAKVCALEEVTPDTLSTLASTLGAAEEIVVISPHPVAATAEL